MKALFYWVVYPLFRPLFLLFVGINTFILGGLAIVISPLDPKGNMAHYVGRFWSLLNLFCNGTRVKIIGTEKIDPNKPYIVMSNHQSHFDVWALIGKLPLQIRWIVKKELRTIPIFGYALTRMGHIYIDRQDRDDAYKGMDRAVEKIKNGTSVIIFPEGTRSSDGRLLRFRLDGATIATKSGVSILPVTVNGGRFALPTRTLALMPGKMQIIIGDEIDPTRFVEGDRTALMAEVKAAIEKNLDLEYGSLV